MDVDNNSDRRYGVYRQERDNLIDAKREASRLFDRAILTLTAGAFGLSLTFVNQIAPRLRTETVSVLKLSWAFFCVSLISTLISFLTSQAACTRQIDIVGAKFLNESSGGEAAGNRAEGTDNLPSDENCKHYEKNWPGLWTRWLNYLSIVGFIIGIALLATFAGVNLSAYK